MGVNPSEKSLFILLGFFFQKCAKPLPLLQPKKALKSQFRAHFPILKFQIVNALAKPKLGISLDVHKKILFSSPGQSITAYYYQNLIFKLGKFYQQIIDTVSYNNRFKGNSRNIINLELFLIRCLV